MRPRSCLERLSSCPMTPSSGSDCGQQVEEICNRILSLSGLTKHAVQEFFEALEDGVKEEWKHQREHAAASQKRGGAEEVKRAPAPLRATQQQKGQVEPKKEVHVERPPSPR